MIRVNHNDLLMMKEELREDPTFLFELLTGEDYNLRIFAISRIPVILAILGRCWF